MIVASMIIGVCFLLFSPEYTKLTGITSHPNGCSVWLLAAAVALFDEWLRYRERRRKAVPLQKTFTTSSKDVDSVQDQQKPRPNIPE
jgi:hypothetical protein